MLKNHNIRIDVSSTNSLKTHSLNHHRLIKKKQLLKKRCSKKQLPKRRMLSTNTREQELSHKFMNKKQVSSEKPSSRKEQLSPTAVMNADTEKPVNACIPSNDCDRSIDQVLPNEQSLPDNLVPTKQLVSEEAVSPEEVQLNDQIPDLNSSVLENNQGQSSSTETIDLDLEEVTDTKNFSCKICDKKYFTEKTLQLHLVTHRKLPQMHYCSLCDYCSECQFAFALHALDHYKKKFKCNNCNRSFYTKNTMALHAETHLSS